MTRPGWIEIPARDGAELLALTEAALRNIETLEQSGHPIGHGTYDRLMRLTVSLTRALNPAPITFPLASLPSWRRV